MSCSDRNAGDVRSWRQLTRVLVVAGATVAGTSAAWLVGQALPADADTADAGPVGVHQHSPELNPPVEQDFRELIPDGRLPADDAGSLPSPADVPAVTGAIVDPLVSAANPDPGADSAELSAAAEPDAAEPDAAEPDAAGSRSVRLDVPPITPEQEATPLLAANAPDSGGLEVELADGDLARAELTTSAPPSLDLGGHTVLPQPAGPAEDPATGHPADADPTTDQRHPGNPAADQPDTPELVDTAAQSGAEQNASSAADASSASAPQLLASASEEDARPAPGDERATVAPRVPAAPHGGCSGPAEPGQPSGIGCHFAHSTAAPPFASGQVPDRSDEVGGLAEPQPGTTPD